MRHPILVFMNINAPFVTCGDVNVSERLVAKAPAVPCQPDTHEVVAIRPLLGKIIHNGERRRFVGDDVILILPVGSVPETGYLRKERSNTLV